MSEDAIRAVQESVEAFRRCLNEALRAAAAHGIAYRMALRERDGVPELTTEGWALRVPETKP